jgi:hypothetical protein
MQVALSPRDRALQKFGSQSRSAVDADQGIQLAEAMWQLGAEMSKDASFRTALGKGWGAIKGIGSWLKGTGRAMVDPTFGKYWGEVRKGKKLISSGGTGAQAGKRSIEYFKSTGMVPDLRHMGMGEQYQLAKHMGRGERLAKKEIHRALKSGMTGEQSFKALSRRGDLEDYYGRMYRSRKVPGSSPYARGAAIARERTVHRHLKDFKEPPKTFGEHFEHWAEKGREFASSHPIMTGIGGVFAAKKTDII